VVRILSALYDSRIRTLAQHLYMRMEGSLRRTRDASHFLPHASSMRCGASEFHHHRHAVAAVTFRTSDIIPDARVGPLYQPQFPYPPRRFEKDIKVRQRSRTIPPAQVSFPNTAFLVSRKRETAVHLPIMGHGDHHTNKGYGALLPRNSDIGYFPNSQRGPYLISNTGTHGVNPAKSCLLLNRDLRRSTPPYFTKKTSADVAVSQTLSPALSASQIPR